MAFSQADEYSVGQLSSPLLRIDELDIRFQGSPILSGISFDINEKELLFIKGPSGSGKSRLLRAIACLDHSWVRITIDLSVSHIRSNHVENLYLPPF
jgi:ABC-type lipoprotein export system ATPase subunit